jgi:hypothetical protein
MYYLPLIAKDSKKKVEQNEEIIKLLLELRELLKK